MSHLQLGLRVLFVVGVACASCRSANAEPTVPKQGFAAICGPVNGESGVYEIGANATIRNLIAAAGGVTEGATSRFTLYTNGAIYDGNNFDTPVQNGDVVLLQRFGGPPKPTRTVVLVSPAGRPIVAEVSASHASLKHLAAKLPVDLAQSARVLWPGQSSPLQDGSIVHVPAVNRPYWNELAARLPVIRPPIDVAASAPAAVVTASPLANAPANLLPQNVGQISAMPQVSPNLAAPQLPEPASMLAMVPEPLPEPQVSSPASWDSSEQLTSGVNGVGELPAIPETLVAPARQWPLAEPAYSSADSTGLASPVLSAAEDRDPYVEAQPATIATVEPAVEPTPMLAVEPQPREPKTTHAVQLEQPVEQIAELSNEFELMSQSVVAPEPAIVEPSAQKSIENSGPKSSNGFLIASAALSLVIATGYLLTQRPESATSESLAGEADPGPAKPTSISEMPVIREEAAASTPLSVAGRVVALGHLRIDAAHDQPSGPHFGPASRKSVRRSEVDVSRLKGDVLGRALAIMDQERG